MGSTTVLRSVPSRCWLPLLLAALGAAGCDTQPHNRLLEVLLDPTLRDAAGARIDPAGMGPERVAFTGTSQDGEALFDVAEDLPLAPIRVEVPADGVEEVEVHGELLRGEDDPFADVPIEGGDVVAPVDGEEQVSVSFPLVMGAAARTSPASR